jgi:hypothetical protein
VARVDLGRASLDVAIDHARCVAPLFLGQDVGIQPAEIACIVGCGQPDELQRQYSEDHHPDAWTTPRSSLVDHDSHPKIPAENETAWPSAKLIDFLRQAVFPQCVWSTKTSGGAAVETRCRGDSGRWVIECATIFFPLSNGDREDEDDVTDPAVGTAGCFCAGC